MIDRLPRCLHTCLHCSHAVICEEYTAYTRKLVFDGCWKTDSIHLPVAREECDKFEESPDRVKRKFWEKWNWKVYVDEALVEQVRPEEGHDEVHEQESERGQGEVHEQSGEQGPGGSEQLIQGSQESCEQPILHIQDLPQGPGLSLKDNAHSNGPDHDQKEGKENAGVAPVQASELLKECGQKEEKEKSDKVHKQPPEQRRNSTRALILQALTHNLTKLKDIAYFAAVDPSTAHYHLRNLIRQERVIKLSWGRYTFPDSPVSKETGKFFEKFLKNSSQSIRVNTGSMELHSAEKNILVDILSKDNRYLQLSERELARRNNISRYKVKKYTHKLEKKRLITIEKGGKQLILTPTQVAIEAFSAFLDSEKIGSKIDSSSSKVQPITSKNWSIINGKGEVSGKDVLQDQFSPGVPEDVGHQSIPSVAGTPENEYQALGTAPEDPGHPDTLPQNVQTFEDYIAWQQKNAHRLIIQFKLLRCNHNRLKGTGWIFGKKSIHKHFTEAFIFKSKDPSKEIINVLPKNPFVFTSPFEFEDQIISFVNEVIDRLKEYGITIDLSEPAEIRLEHVALEDNAFSRKLIRKGLLYFKSKIQAVDSNGEVITYAIAIDKSKKLHIEFEGREAHHMAENVEAFVDDVASGKIDRKELREMPYTVKGIKTQVKEEFERIEKKLSSNVERIHTTQAVLHDNQLEFSQNLVSHTKMVQTIGEAADSVNRAADTIREVTESLKECLQLFRKGMESFTSKNSNTVSGSSGGIE